MHTETHALPIRITSQWKCGYTMKSERHICISNNIKKGLISTLIDQIKIALPMDKIFH